MRRRNLLGSGGITGLTLSSSGGTVGVSGSVVVYIFFNGEPLTVPSSDININKPSWVKSGYRQDYGIITFTCDTNPSLTSNRSTAITISYSGYSVTYQLVQSHGTNLTFSPSSIYGPSYDGNQAITVEINNCAVNDLSLLTINSYDGTITSCYKIPGNNGQFAIEWGMNTDTTSDVTSYVYLTYQGYSHTCSVTQEADYKIETREVAGDIFYDDKSLVSINSIGLPVNACGDEFGFWDFDSIRATIYYTALSDKKRTYDIYDIYNSGNEVYVGSETRTIETNVNHNTKQSANPNITSSKVCGYTNKTFTVNLELVGTVTFYLFTSDGRTICHSQEANGDRVTVTCGNLEQTTCAACDSF